MDKPLTKWTSQDFIIYFRGMSTKQKIQLGSLMGGGLVFMLFVFWPAWVLRPPVGAQVQGLRNSLLLAEAQIRQEPKIVEEGRQYESFIRESLGRLLTEAESNGLTGTLSEISEKSGVTILSSQPAMELTAVPEPFNQRFAPVSYVLAVEGGYHALAGFIHEIESHPKILRVDEFSVSSGEEIPTRLVGEIKVTGFWLKTGQAIQALPHEAG